MRSRGAWVLAGLQFVFSAAFLIYLRKTFPPGLSDVSFLDAPTWFIVINCINFGVAALLAACARYKPETTAFALLTVIHIVCPLLFFTDLTRNPYFTQITLFNIWVSILWAAILVDALDRKTLVFPRTALNLPLFAFLGVATLSWALAFARHPERFHPSMAAEGLRNWLFLIVNCLAVFFIAYSIDEKWRGRFLWLTFWVGGVAAAYGLMQFYGVERIWSKSLTPFANRPVSTFGNPNFLSSYLLLIIPLLTVKLMTAKTRLESGITLTLLVTVVTGLIATMTRSTWVGAVVGLAVLPLAPPVREIIRSNIKRFCVFGAIVLASVIFWPKSKLGGYRNPWERLIELKEIGTGKAYHPWSQRILIWTSSFLMVKDHPAFGKGWGLMELFYPYYQGSLLFHPVIGDFRTHANNSHNEVLEIWSQTGTVGLGIYVWLWVILVLFGLKLARSSSAAQAPPGKNLSSQNPFPPSLWGWALAAACLGMLVDNFFGNVSLHFCVPAFLFWWQAGLLFGMGKTGTKKPDQESAQDYHLIPLSDNLRVSGIALAIVFFTASAVIAFRKEFQEIFYFNGFKITKGSNAFDVARSQLEEAWKWFPREVNTNYELSNTYARLSQESNKQGIKPQAEAFRKKALWAYVESLRSNCGYDEIYFNLAATQVGSGWTEDEAPDLEVDLPDGRLFREPAAKKGGAIRNFTRALRINPASQEAYNFLGNIYLQGGEKYHKEAVLLFQQALRFFPKNKDFLVNMAYLKIQEKNFDEAIVHLVMAMNEDPFYDITRKNLRAVLSQGGLMNNHPLAEVDRILNEVNGWVQAKNWPVMKERLEFSVKILPEGAPLRLLLANVYFEIKDWDKAEAAYLKTLELDPANLTAARNLALAYRLQGRTREARLAYERAARISPTDADIKKALEELPK